MLINWQEKIRASTKNVSFKSKIMILWSMDSGGWKMDVGLLGGRFWRHKLQQRRHLSLNIRVWQMATLPQVLQKHDQAAKFRARSSSYLLRELVKKFSWTHDDSPAGSLGSACNPESFSSISGLVSSESFTDMAGEIWCDKLCLWAGVGVICWETFSGTSHWEVISFWHVILKNTLSVSHTSRPVAAGPTSNAEIMKSLLVIFHVCWPGPDKFISYV